MIFCCPSAFFIVVDVHGKIIESYENCSKLALLIEVRALPI